MKVWWCRLSDLATLDPATLGVDGPTDLITLTDPGLPHPEKPPWVRDHLQLSFHDIDEPMPGFTEPNREHASALFHFHDNRRDAAGLVVACLAAAGRSQAVVAALNTLHDMQPKMIFSLATYNRLLYQLIVEAGGGYVPPEPLVSIVVRIKYPGDRLSALLLSLRRQRWKNWELISVTDGSRYDTAGYCDSRHVVIQTEQRQERWGHPHRQQGIDAARGAFIALGNDDNYYTPGFIDQMVYALQSQDADMAVCHYLGHYLGWQHIPAVPKAGHCDLGCFMAKASLVRSVPWEGQEFNSDGLYIEKLARKAGKVVEVSRPLFIHN